MLELDKIQKLASQQVAKQQHLIDGKAHPPASGEYLATLSPIDGQAFTEVASGNKADIDLAVAVARQRFEQRAWLNMSHTQRKQVMLKWAALIEEHALELAVLGVRDNGTEISMAIKAEPLSAAQTIRFYAEAIDKHYGEVAPNSMNQLGLVIPEPVGVVGVIVPWNFPLMIASWKIAPALAMGNSVVIKPAEIASLSLLKYASLALEAGLPEGVLNIVTGRGSVVGEALALHSEVDVLAFTGSGMIGRRLLEYSAQSNLKRVYLELGGKSANLVFADTNDIDAAVNAAVNGIFRNSGQVCISASRLLLQQDIHDEFVDKLTTKAENLNIGNPLNPASNVGAVSSETQLQQNLNYVDIARNEGATLCSGGNALEAVKGGYYMQPTVFTDVQADMRIAQEEVFGPVLSILKFKDEAEAISIANNSELGLSSGLWTSDMGIAHRVARSINAGIVHINTYGGSDITVPLGGVKQSGNGYDKSLHALDKYVNMKSIWQKFRR